MMLLLSELLVVMVLGEMALGEDALSETALGETALGEIAVRHNCRPPIHVAHETHRFELSMCSIYNIY